MKDEWSQPPSATLRTDTAVQSTGSEDPLPACGLGPASAWGLGQMQAIGEGGERYFYALPLLAFTLHSKAWGVQGVSSLELCSTLGRGMHGLGPGERAGEMVEANRE